MLRSPAIKLSLRTFIFTSIFFYSGRKMISLLNVFFVFFAVVFSFYLLFVFIYPFKQEFKRKEKYDPFISVIIPCKGTSEEFTNFLKSLRKQNYKKIEFIFALANSKDQAIKEINRIMKGAKYRIVISKYVAGTSEKNQNILSALDKIIKITEVIVFLDSDGILDGNYIYSLCEPLQDERYMVSSTYRKYEAKSIGGLIIKYWNLFSLTMKNSLFGKFVWTGGLAFRKRDAEKLEIKRLLATHLSDDMSFSRLLAEKKYNIFSVKNYTLSETDKTVWGALKWISRQQFMGYNYYPYLHYINIISLFLHIIFLIFFITTLNILYLLPFFSIFIVIFYFSVRYGNLEETIATPLIFVLFIINTFYSSIFPMLTRKIEWAGIVYELDRNGRVINRYPV